MLFSSSSEKINGGISMKENYNLGIRASIVTIVINIILTVVKLVAGLVGRSSAMLADGVHTLSDVLSTVVVMVGLKVSSREPDETHPYGHERFELVFSKILSVFLVVTGLYIGYEGIKTLTGGSIETPGRIALWAAIISILAKEFMYRYTINVAKKIESVSMEADAWHHRSDALSSIGTFIGIFGARLGFPILDPIAGIIVSLMVIKVGVDLYLKSIRGLVDEAADEDVLEKIERLTYEVEGVKNISDLKTRVFANKIYVDIDIEVDGCKRVHEGHDIAQEVHDQVERKIKNVKHCMVHVEPFQDDCDC